MASIQTIQPGDNIQSFLDLLNQTGEWIFESTHTGDKYGTPGRTLYVNMEKMLKAINDKFGWDFVKEYYIDSEGNKVSEAEAKIHYEKLKKINN